MTKKQTRRKKVKKRNSKGRRSWRRRLLSVFWKGALACVVLIFFFLVYSYTAISNRLEGQVWDVPNRVVSAELPLRAGDVQPLDRLVERLQRTGHIEAEFVSQPGRFKKERNRLQVWPIEDSFDGVLTLEYSDDRILRMRGPDGFRVDEWTLPPEPIAVLYGDVRIDREVVAIEEIPTSLIQAVLAAEDSRFYEHFGLDPFAIVRASARNVKAGKVVQGGSTITQQTVKNLFLDARRTYWRKIREAGMALMLEWRESKDRILELYLNEMYLGQRGAVSVCGVASASKFYFGKPVTELTLGESALLAGIIRSPGNYNPYQHPERALERRNQVLTAMLEEGVIDRVKYEHAIAEKPKFMDTGVPSRPSPWALDYILDEARQKLGDEAFTHGGVTLTTTLDLRFQHAAEKALQKTLKSMDPNGKLEGAVVVLDPKTGAIRALVGGRNYARSQFDRARDAKRQPGSVFKPFVYAAALAEGASGRGVTASTPIEDAPLELQYDGKRWSPRNYDREYVGPLTVREALIKSRNIPAVLVGEQVGMARVANLASQMGVQSNLQPHPALALGTSEVSPLEMAVAYCSFASGGIKRSPYALSGWQDQAGRQEQWAVPSGEKVLDPRVAFLVNDILMGVFDNGTASRARRLGFYGLAAGKTGTTNDTRDSWFVGYTPEWVALVWIGSDDNQRTGKTGATGALIVWTEFVKQAGEAGVRHRFRPPDGVIRRSIDPESNQLARRACDLRYEEWYIRGTEPTERCNLHRGGMRDWFRRWRNQRNIEGDV